MLGKKTAGNYNRNDSNVFENGTVNEVKQTWDFSILSLVLHF